MDSSLLFLQFNYETPLLRELAIAMNMAVHGEVGVAAEFLGTTPCFA
jgi:hypothetical protein